MAKITHEEWTNIADQFGKAQPSSPQWFAITDAVLTYLLQEKLRETATPLPNGNGDAAA